MRKNFAKVFIKIICLFIFIILVFDTSRVFARKKFDNIKSAELTEEYKEWLELPDEEKVKRIIPRKFEIPKEEKKYQNVLKYARFLRRYFIK